MNIDENSKTNFGVVATYVDINLKRKADGDLESASGSGSAVEVTAPIRGFIEDVIRRHDVRTMLDLGCGDWNWMRLVSLQNPHSGEPVRYQGWESHQSLVTNLNDAYGNDTTSFFHKDIATEPFLVLI